MKIGDIVTITTDHVYGVDDYYPVHMETGVIVSYDDETKQYQIVTCNPASDEWWFTEDEFRLATDEEVRARLRFAVNRYYRYKI